MGGVVGFLGIKLGNGFADATQMLRVSIIAFAVAALPLSASAQDPQAPAPHQHESATTTQWTWSFDANVFYGFNKQVRLFADSSSWESQNWAMLAAERSVPGGRLILSGMLSLEDFHTAEGRLPSALSDWRELSASTARELSTPP